MLGILSGEIRTFQEEKEHFTYQVLKNDRNSNFQQKPLETFIRIGMWYKSTYEFH